MEQFLTTLQTRTEDFLTWRKKKKKIKQEKQKKKGVIRDWLEAFVWAACVVLLLNQYLFQAYQVPTGSMKETIVPKDQLFVNKFVYGPELLPGMLKLEGPRKPTRNDIIVFTNPDYKSKGTAFELVHRIIYMMTLSLIDIDRDANGDPSKHFLVKRAIGVGGDRLKADMNSGDMSFLPEGEKDWLIEKEFQKISKGTYTVNRYLTPQVYEAIKGGAMVTAFSTLKLNPPKEYSNSLMIVRDLKSEEISSLEMYDKLSFSYWKNKTLYAVNPHQDYERKNFTRSELGYYIPKGYVLPMGDNRDNSRDGRYFGAVPQQTVLGEAVFTYWPLDRIGPLK